MSKFEKKKLVERSIKNFTFYYTYLYMPNYFKSLSLTNISKAYKPYFKNEVYLEKIITEQKIMVNDYSQQQVFPNQFYLFKLRKQNTVILTLWSDSN